MKPIKRSPINHDTGFIVVSGCVITKYDMRMDADIEVRYTNDRQGKSMSFADPETGIMFAVPFEPVEMLLREINKGK